jgi:putative flavoprotein involved in K+ transport
VSTTHAGLGYVGLEFQRSFSSNSLRGVHRDAYYVIAALGSPSRPAHRAAVRG